MKARFAPSPTGEIHLGNARTALFNALLALGQAACFLLRVEDTDPVRSKEAYYTQLLEDLNWLGMTWQEGPIVGGDAGPYRQSERQAIYDDYYQKLEDAGLAYPCFCSEDHLALTKKAQRASGQPPRYPGTCRHLSKEEREQKYQEGLKPTLRFKVPKGAEIRFEDAVRGHQFFLADDIGDFIIRRADGTASFMYCNAIDDAMMQVTHVVRGEDHLTNSPRQIMILQALDLPVPKYVHISMITGMDGAPLSKRNGSQSIRALKEAGYLPLALVNYLARLGHYYQNNDFMDFKTLATQFSIEYLNASAAKYDPDQLNYWQKQAIQALDTQALADWLHPYCADKVPSAHQTHFFGLVKDNITFATESTVWASICFDENLACSPDALEDMRAFPEMTWPALVQGIEQHFNDYDAMIANLKKAHNLKGKGLFKPLRLALTGRHDGPKLPDLLKIMGQDLALTRLKQAAQALKDSAC